MHPAVRLTALIAATALVFATAACGGDSSDGSTGDREAIDKSTVEGTTESTTDLTDLAGRTLVVTEVERNGEPHPIVEGTQIRFNFAEERVSVETGCNTLSGGWKRADDTLTFGQMMATMIGCEAQVAAQQEMLSEALEGAFVVEGDTFVAGDLTFHLADREVVSPDVDLAGQRWHLEALVDDQAVSSVPRGVKAWLEFDGSTLTVDAGCNHGHGVAAREGDFLVIKGIGTTRKACPGDRGDVEKHVLAVLQGKVHVRVREQTLTVTGADGLALVLSADTR